VLYRPEAYEPLTETQWNEGRVRDAIRAIVADTDAAMRGPKLMWRADPWDGWNATSPMKNLYVGAAGVLWALDQLGRRGHAESALDLADLAQRNLELFRAKPDFIKLAAFRPPEPRESSLLVGEAGILLVTWRLAPSDDLADALHARVRANVDNEAEEVMWGSPGSLITARAMYEWTGDERWRDAWKESAEALLARRAEDGLWTQRLYGQVYTSLTPPHGVVGNLQSLLPLLDDRRADALKRDTAAILVRTAHRENGLANWPPRPRPELAGPDGEIRVQWCAGSPGIVIGAADYLDEDLLLAGAELPWRAGPPNDVKGPGICHGTAGNGYAFLKAFDRTGDEEWLDRARRFAVHALEQAQRMPSRHSLFTGGIGAALYAADCLDARSAYPLIEYV
jgi:lantibiotic modifying enzyme